MIKFSSEVTVSAVTTVKIFGITVFKKVSGPMVYVLTKNGLRLKEK